MPKGDRLKLKADPEDGTTPIANLLLDALAMSKLSGIQVRAIMHLWRETYGWVSSDGKRRKEAKIPLSEWRDALDSNCGGLSHCLSDLVKKNILKRRVADNWGGYFYCINTNISTWNNGSIDLDKFCGKLGITQNAIDTQTTTVTQNATTLENGNSCELDNSTPNEGATVTQNATQQLPKTQHPTLYKEILNKDKEIIGDDKSSPNLPISKNKNGEYVKLVFAKLDDIRGYRPTVARKGEAASIIRMLKTYTPEQIIATWKQLKQETFWKDKELFMMSVEKQIGAIVNKLNIKNETVRSNRYEPVN